MSLLTAHVSNAQNDTDARISNVAKAWMSLPGVVRKGRLSAERIARDLGKHKNVGPAFYKEGADLLAAKYAS